MLNPNKTGLIIIDVQGKLATLMHDADAMIQATVAMIEGAKALDLPILWLEQNPEKLGETHPQLAEVLAPLQPITKYTFSACGEPAFIDAVEASGVHTWLVAGIEAHICVCQTVRELLEHGRNVEVVTDCVSSRTPENRILGIQRMISAGAKQTSVEMSLFELLGDCRAAAFRDVLKVIK